MENKKKTIHDIAAELGITASTVSRALNNNPRISKSTREKVQKLARELNYQPNKLAASLRNGRGKSIGVIVPRINRSFFSNAISGIESITNPAGYTLMICQSNEDLSTEEKALQSLLNNRVDGIIMSISANTRNGLHIQKAIDEGIHVVQFDRVCKELPVSKVVNDNFDGAYRLTKHLLSKGYKKIYHFSGPLHINVYQERFAGYEKAMQEAGISLTKEMHYENVLTRVQGGELALDLEKQKKMPEAILCTSDFSALGALIALRDLNNGASSEVEIVGFGNEPFTELMEPGMTSVEQFSVEMGMEAARLLIDSVENKQAANKPKEIIINTKLITR
jgi:LacI family transcriptional regulator